MLRGVGFLSLAANLFLQGLFVLLGRQSAKVITMISKIIGSSLRTIFSSARRLEPFNQRRAIERDEDKGEDNHEPVSQRVGSSL